MINYGGRNFIIHISAKDRAQDINLNQLKLKVNATYRKDEETTTNFEPINDSDVLNKAYLEAQLTKIEGHISHTEKKDDEFKMHTKKQSVKEMLIDRAVNTTIQILYDKGLLDNYDNADEVMEDCFLVERRRPG